MPPAESPVTVAELKAQLRITNDFEDAELQQFIDVATSYVEEFTRRWLVERTARTYRDWFVLDGFEIRRSALLSIDSIEYKKDGVMQAVDPSVYYATQETDYSKVLPMPNQSWPNDVDPVLQSIHITFKAGYGSAADVPSALKQAVLMIAAGLYSNRGDCECDSAGAEKSAPNATKRVLLQWRIENI